MEHQQRHDRTGLPAGRFIFIHRFCPYAREHVGNGPEIVYCYRVRISNANANGNPDANAFRHGNPDANGHPYTGTYRSV